MTGRWCGGWLGAWLLLGLVGGCGGGGSAAAYAEVIQGKLAVEQEEIEVLQGVRDEASMKAARERLKELDGKLRQIGARFKALGPAPPEVQARLEDEFRSRAQYNIQTLQEELRRIRQLPGGPEFLGRLSSALPP